MSSQYTSFVVLFEILSSIFFFNCPASTAARILVAQQTACCMLSEHSITAAYTSSLENLASRLDSQARTASISRTVQRGGLAVTKSRMRRKGGGELEGVYRRGK